MSVRTLGRRESFWVATAVVAHTHGQAQHRQ